MAEAASMRSLIARRELRSYGELMLAAVALLGLVARGRGMDYGSDFESAHLLRPRSVALPASHAEAYARFAECSSRALKPDARSFSSVDLRLRPDGKRRYLVGRCRFKTICRALFGVGMLASSS